MVVNTPLVFAENRSDKIVNPLAIAEILSDSTEKYATITFDSFEFKISLDELYDRVDLE